MNLSLKIWTFIPKNMHDQPRKADKRKRKMGTRLGTTGTVYVQIKAISNTWDYAVTL